MSNFSISVVIINWNHGTLIPMCLDSIRRQTEPPLEVFIFDNHSEDGSAEWISTHYPEFRLVRNVENVGFSRALNAGIRISRGKWILSLNPDVQLKPDFIEQFRNWAEKDDDMGILAPRLLKAKDLSRVDSAGLFLDRRRRPYDRGQGCLNGSVFDQPGSVFGACGGAALYRRTMLEDVRVGEEYFDEDFFAYYEDVDLAWRAQILGWNAVYVPTATATHVRGSGDTIRNSIQIKTRMSGARLALRNRLLMMVKNDRPGDIFRDLPWIVCPDLLRIVYLLLIKPTVLLGYVDFLRLTGAAYRKRQIIAGKLQSKRRACVRPWLVRSFREA